MDFVVEAVVCGPMPEVVFEKCLDDLEMRAKEEVEVLFGARDIPNCTSFVFVAQGGHLTHAKNRCKNVLGPVLKAQGYGDLKVEYQGHLAEYEKKEEHFATTMVAALA